MQALLAPAQVVGVIAGPARDPAAIDLDDARGQRAQKTTIVGHEQHRAVEAEQQLLQPVDRLDVEVVGRLIQQQHVGCEHECAREQHAPLHAARQVGEPGLGRQFQSREHAIHAPVQVPALLRVDARLHARERIGMAGQLELVAELVELREQCAQFAQRRGHHIEHAARKSMRHFLREPGHAHAALHAHLAIVGAQFARDQPQQRRLARAVATDDAHAFARLDHEVDLVQQQRTADRVIDPKQLNQCHAGARAAETGDCAVPAPAVSVAIGPCRPQASPRAC